MSDIVKCWWCSGTAVACCHDEWSVGVWIGCDDCSAAGPHKPTTAEAIAAWNTGPATQWHDIATAPQDRMVLVYAVEDPEKVPPECKGLEPLICTTKWHPDAGWCVCEVREATHWTELPKGPKK